VRAVADLRGRRERRRGLRATWAALALALCAALLAAPSANAAPTISIAAARDPVESLTTQLTTSGTLDDAREVAIVHVEPAGTPACPANPVSDTGSEVLWATPGAAPYVQRANWTFALAGTYLLCGWVAQNAGHDAPVLAATSLPLAVRRPRLSLALAAPAAVARARSFRLAATVRTEARRDVHVAVLADNGSGCPANWSAATAAPGEQTLLGLTVTGGPTLETTRVRIPTTGRYLACGYVDLPGMDAAPEATASRSLTVLAPCVVPRLGRRVTLRAAKRRVLAAGCTVGAVRFVRRTHRAGGTVIALDPKPGTVRPPRARVRITVASG